MEDKQMLGLSARDYMRNIVKDSVKSFNELIRWEDKDYKDYEVLLNRLKGINAKRRNETTKEKGEALEDIVSFIIERTFILTAHRNKRTPTNEIDHFVVLNDHGKQSLHTYNIAPSILEFTNGYFLCECKDYGRSVGSTWVGKFYSLLKTCGNCSLGIIFSYNGLSGAENNWYDAHGLTKIIYRIEPEDKKIFILDFNKRDFERILEGESFFNIIKTKKLALQMNGVAEKLREHHANEEFMKETLEEYFIK